MSNLVRKLFDEFQSMDKDTGSMIQRDRMVASAFVEALDEDTSGIPS